jgi:hypothetical protein
MTPLDLALRQGHSRIAKELLQHQGQSVAPASGADRRASFWCRADQRRQPAHAPDALWGVLRGRRRSAVAIEMAATASLASKSVGKKARVHPQISASVRNLLDQTSYNNSGPSASGGRRNSLPSASGGRRYHSSRDSSELEKAGRPVFHRARTSFYGAPPWEDRSGLARNSFYKDSSRGSDLVGIGEDEDDNKSDDAAEEVEGFEFDPGVRVACP